MRSICWATDRIDPSVTVNGLYMYSGGWTEIQFLLNSVLVMKVRWHQINPSGLQHFYHIAKPDQIRQLVLHCPWNDILSTFKMLKSQLNLPYLFGQIVLTCCRNPVTGCSVLDHMTCSINNTLILQQKLPPLTLSLSPHGWIFLCVSRAASPCTEISIQIFIPIYLVSNQNEKIARSVLGAI